VVDVEMMERRLHPEAPCRRKTTTCRYKGLVNSWDMIYLTMPAW